VDEIVWHATWMNSVWHKGGVIKDIWDGKVVGVGSDKPPRILQGMEKPLGKKVVSQELGQGGQGRVLSCSHGIMMGGMRIVVDGMMVVQET
jgi:hypothetical protein